MLPSNVKKWTARPLSRNLNELASAVNPPPKTRLSPALLFQCPTIDEIPPRFPALRPMQSVHCSSMRYARICRSRDVCDHRLALKNAIGSTSWPIALKRPKPSQAPAWY